MEIKLNGETINFQLENEKTMGVALGAIEENCRKEKMTIIEVKVNGKALSLEELDNFFQTSTDNNDEIELFTLSGFNIKNMLKKIGQDLCNLSEELESISVKMQSGEDQDAIQIIENFSISLQDLYTTAKFFDLAEIDNDYKFGDKNLNEYQQEFSEKLKILVEGFENNDSIEVSDIAEYELSPLAKELGNSLLSIG